MFFPAVVRVDAASADLAVGTRLLTRSGCCALYGTRANIDQVSIVPPAPPAAGALTAARVGVQNGPNQAETGYIRTSQGFGWSDCPDVSTGRRQFYEFLRVPALGLKVCDAFPDISGPLKATVCHRSGGASNTRWSVFLNGALLNTVDIATLPTSANLSAFVGNEINGNVAGTPSQQARYGVDLTPWQRYTSSDCVGAVSVQSSGFCNTDQNAATQCSGGSWSIQPLPSPFLISR